MTRRRSGTTGRRDPYHVGLDADKVIDAAVELSRGDGLTAWTLRDLGGRLGVAPSVIYHHVGGREALSRHVVERILTLVGQPTTAMPWRQWFREALYPLRPVLTDYPGTARWLLLHGPVLPRLAPVIDAGIASLRRAGFGRDAALAYTSLVNTAMMTIAAIDDRRLHEDDGPRDHAALIRDLGPITAGSAGISLLTRDLLTRFTGTPQEIAAAQDRYYRFVVEAMRVDGSEPRIAARAGLKLGKEDIVFTSATAATIALQLNGPNLRAKWNEGRITAGELWGIFTRYPYMPRLRDERVFRAALASAMDDMGWESGGFALASGYDAERGDFIALRVPPHDDAPPITDETVLVAPALSVDAIGAGDARHARKVGARHMENSEKTLLYAIEEQEKKTGTTLVRRKGKKSQEDAE